MLGPLYAAVITGIVIWYFQDSLDRPGLEREFTNRFFYIFGLVSMIIGVVGLILGACIYLWANNKKKSMKFQVDNLKDSGIT